MIASTEKALLLSMPELSRVKIVKLTNDETGDYCYKCTAKIRNRTYIKLLECEEGALFIKLRRMLNNYIF